MDETAPMATATVAAAIDVSGPMATATAAAGCNSGGSNHDCGDRHRGNYHCSDGNCDSGSCDSGGCDSGDSDSNHGNGITAGAIIWLNKALYELTRQRDSGTKTDGFPRSLGFTQSHADRNLYIYGAGPSQVLLLYVDDISLAYASTAIKAVDNIKAKLAAKHRITNLGTRSPIPRNREHQREHK